jgi:hypothetical protein
VPLLPSVTEIPTRHSRHAILGGGEIGVDSTDSQQKTVSGTSDQIFDEAETSYEEMR